MVVSLRSCPDLFAAVIGISKVWANSGLPKLALRLGSWRNAAGNSARRECRLAKFESAGRDEECRSHTLLA